MRHHPLRLADRRQVVRAIPLREQRRGSGRAWRARPAAAMPPAAPSCSRPSSRSIARSCATAARPVAGSCAAPRRRPPARETALQVHEQQRDRGGRDPRDARRLADRFGPVQIQLLLHLGRQAAHRAVVEVGREPQTSPARDGARSRRAADRCSRRTWWRSRPARRPPRRRRRRRRPAASSARRRSRPAGAGARSASTRARSAGPRTRCASSAATRCRIDPRGIRAARARARSRRACAQNASQRASSTTPSSRPALGQPQVGVVLAQLQPILGAAGEHPVRLGHAARDQVVDQHAEVRLVAPRATSRRRRGRTAPALMPASRPCAAASSYPVVPLICPAKKRPRIALVSSVDFSARGSK